MSFLNGGAALLLGFYSLRLLLVILAIVFTRRGSFKSSLQVRATVLLYLISTVHINVSMLFCTDSVASSVQPPLHLHVGRCWAPIRGSRGDEILFTGGVGGCSFLFFGCSFEIHRFLFSPFCLGKPFFDKSHFPFVPPVILIKLHGAPSSSW